MYVLLLNFSRTPGLRLVQKHKQQSHKRRNCSLSRVHPGEESIRRIWEHLPTQSIRESERAALKGAPIFLGHREKHNRDCRRYPANDDAVINANINLCPTFIPRPLGFINLPASPILSLSLSLFLCSFVPPSFYPRPTIRTRANFWALSRSRVATKSEINHENPMINLSFGYTAKFLSSLI